MHDATEDALRCIPQQAPGRRRKHWWTTACSTARNRCRLFFHIWKSLGRPPEGVAYDCYKEARRSYRRTCRRAVNSKIQRAYDLMAQLYRTKQPGRFWNPVKKSRSTAPNWTAIAMESLHSHFKDKFAAREPTNDFLKRTADQVQQKFNDIKDNLLTDVISEHKVARLIKKLRTGCSPGVDGITSEHLLYSAGTSLSLHFSLLLTLLENGSSSQGVQHRATDTDH